MADENNAALTDTNGKELDAPVPVTEGDTPKLNSPTIPPKARGQIANSSISFANSNLTHVCNFSDKAVKDNQLKKFLNSQAHNIREGIRVVMLELGTTDATGQYQWLIDNLKAITRELKRFQKEILKPIMDFEKYVIGYLRKIEQTIAWILKQPARLFAFLVQCLKDLYASIASIFTDAVSSSAGSASNSVGFSDVVSAAKETAATFTQTIGQSVKIATTAIAASAGVVKTVQSVGKIYKKGI
jgi:hypothetical protein